METILWIVVIYFLFVKKTAGTGSGSGGATGPATEAALYGAYISNEDLMLYNSASSTVDGSWDDNLGFNIGNALDNGNTSTQNNNKPRWFNGPDVRPMPHSPVNSGF